MNDDETLLQRFLDNDLSPEERLRFFEMLHHDAALRQRLVETERVIAQAHQLPRLVPGPAAIQRVLNQITPPSRSFGDRLREFMLGPHVLRWNVARATAIMCALIVLTWVVGSILPRPTGLKMTLQPVPSETVYVRLALIDPQAQSVAIAGDFNGWKPERTPLHRSGNGLWTLTIPLRPGRYQYMYRVDGRWVTDPSASEWSPDGFGEENAVLDVHAAAHSEGRSIEEQISVQ